MSHRNPLEVVATGKPLGSQKTKDAHCKASEMKPSLPGAGGGGGGAAGKESTLQK